MVNNFKFEESLKRLEEIVDLLEKGECDLDKSLELFQEGIELVKKCENKLKDIEDNSVKIIENNKIDNFNI